MTVGRKFFFRSIFNQAEKSLRLFLNKSLKKYLKVNLKVYI